MMSDNPRMTGRLRFQVKLLGTLASDLAGGTELEQAVSMLLNYVATMIVNDQVAEATRAIEHGVPWRPRADRVAAKLAADVAATDAQDLEGA